MIVQLLELVDMIHFQINVHIMHRIQMQYVYKKILTSDITLRLLEVMIQDAFKVVSRSIIHIQAKDRIKGAIKAK